VFSSLSVLFHCLKSRPALRGWLKAGTCSLLTAGRLALLFLVHLSFVFFSSLPILVPYGVVCFFHSRSLILSWTYAAAFVPASLTSCLTQLPSRFHGSYIIFPLCVFRRPPKCSFRTSLPTVPLVFRRLLRKDELCRFYVLCVTDPVSRFFVFVLPTRQNWAGKLVVAWWCRASRGSLLPFPDTDSSICHIILHCFCLTLVRFYVSAPGLFFRTLRSFPAGFPRLIGSVLPSEGL